MSASGSAGVRAVAIWVALAIGVALPAAAWGGPSGPPPAPSAAVAKAKAPAPGDYRGKVGTLARISFNVKGKRLRGLAAGVNALCQRASDGFLTRFQLLAIQLGKSEQLKITGKGPWRFSGSGTAANGVGWEIDGRINRKGVASGSFEASAFYLLPYFDSELCSGSESFTAKRK